MKACIFCGHPKEIHRGSCGAKDCDCVSADIEETAMIDWQEAALMQCIDLIMGEKEGTVHVPRPDGTNCVIKIQFEPETGYALSVGGEA